MAYPSGAVQVTGFIGTTSVLDTYATHLDFLGFGGLRAVADTTARDTITTQRRTFGMIAVCQDGSGSYILSNVAMGGTDNVLSNNANWLPYTTGSTTTFINANPTTITVGGYPLGSTFPTAQTMQQMWDGLMYPYIPPTFSSFLISGFPTTYEVGDGIGGSESFAWSFSNPALVTASTMDILDVTASTTIASGISIVSPSTQTIATYTPIVPASYQWRGRATDTQSNVFNSALFTATWQWREYYGVSPLATLNATQILALTNNPLSSGLAGTYNFAILDYKYFVWSDSFGSPTAVTGFKDASTGLSLSMADSSDDAFYSTTQNGWSYGTVAVTNSFSVTQNYRVYRTKNTLGSVLQALVS
jgi:hypothetical protein